jgi:hypothetical protein
MMHALIFDTLGIFFKVIANFGGSAFIKKYKVCLSGSFGLEKLDIEVLL